MNEAVETLKLKQLGIDTYREAVIYIREDSQICRSEGFEVHARVCVTLGDKTILATLNTIENGLLESGEVALSKYAWKLLDAQEGLNITLSHPKPLQSLSYVRSKIYGHSLEAHAFNHIIEDIASGRYSDIHIATFLTACAVGKLSEHEIIELTRAMTRVGERLEWDEAMVVDKHCVGGIPGNRTTPIVVSIVASFGLTMPKTSSRAITSPAGTADTMETLAPVNLSSSDMRRVVETEQGCIVWGGSVHLSPADDIMIRVERVIDLDSEGQLIASVLSKKLSAGSSHILIDIPMGAKAKVRTLDMAKSYERWFQRVGEALGLHIKTLVTDGSQPVGRGIGPALEARDILAVLQNDAKAPADLRDRAIAIAGTILEFSDDIETGSGAEVARGILSTGKAWQKFQAICDAQGGMREPKVAAYSHTIEAKYAGRVNSIDNRQLSRLAKLAGAPHDKAAGVLVYTPLESLVEPGDPFYTLYAESRGALNYALSLLEQIPDIIQVERLA